MEYISPEGLRQDGRRAHELRQLSSKIGVMDRPDGSAFFEMGNTKIAVLRANCDAADMASLYLSTCATPPRPRLLLQVLAAVAGPRAGASSSASSTSGTIKCDAAFASFASGDRRRRGKRERRVQEIVNAVQTVMEQTVLLDLLPKSEIEIYLQILQADGAEKAACVNAAMLAIANAGVPVRDLVAACTVGYLESTALLDLNLTEIQARGPQTTLAVYPNLDQIVYIDSFGGNLQIDSFEEACDLGIEGCKAVADFMRTSLLAHTKRLAGCHG